jgi:superfamily II DNA or RNA helicase
MIRVRIGAEISLCVAELSPRLCKAIENMFTFVNPEYEKRKRQNRYIKSTPQFLRFYRHREGWLYVPRGAINRVRVALTEHGADPKFLTRDVVSRSRGKIPLEDYDVSLRPYQLDGLRAMHERVQGVVQMPCGAGKTELGAAALLTTGEPGLVIVHTEDILEQWKHRIHRMSREWPRVISGTKKSDLSPLNVGETAVAMIQTLNSAGPKAEAFLASVGAVLTDECHHIPARTWASVLNNIKARFRWGLTATPYRNDGLSFLLKLTMGDTIYSVDTDYLIKNGYLHRPLIVPVWTGWVVPEDCYPVTVLCPACLKWRPTTRSKHQTGGSRCKPCKSQIPQVADMQMGKLNYTKAVSEMSLDAGRMEIIRRLVKSATDDGRTTLVLVPRKAAVTSLVTKLRWENIDAVGVTSDYDKYTRAKLLKDIREKRASVIVATQLADEGLDLPAIDCAINTSAGRHTGTAKQRVGRTLRKSGRDPIVFDFVDTSEFERQWMIRAAAYRKEYGKCFYNGEPIDPDKAIEVFRKERDRQGQNMTGM